MRFRRPKTPPPRLEVHCDPVLRAGAPARLTIETGAGELRVHLRLLGWDRRRAEKWLLAERTVDEGSHVIEVLVPSGLAPGCARMTEYAVYAELAGTRAVAAVPIRLVGDVVWSPDDPGAAGEGIALEDDVVPIGGTLRGHVHGPAEVGAELHTEAAEPRFLPVAAVEGAFEVAIPLDVAPTLHDGESLGISWVVRTGAGHRRFAVVDPEGVAGERLDERLTFLAQLARDPFALRR